ncbi:Dihydrolipoyllysine-residue acetyltransferase component of acetoin cleaving system [Paramyrothecium foliicola]|nr:Dihydrolipoyllysine-residue acetyltransferase component of acetoin cleaving system [Paramyrothecium foliicola]
MASAKQEDLTSLNQSFRYQSSTHSFEIKWTSLGNTESAPLVFIHGTPWSSQVWEPFALALSRQFHVYLFDRPGFGDSPAECQLPGAAETTSKVVEFDGNLARQAEVVAALLQMWHKDWAGQKPHVVAHDNAGLISLRAHLLHGCQYASLCLLDVVAIGPFGQPLFEALAKDPQSFEQLPDMAIEGIVESYIRNAAYKQLLAEDMQMLKAPWLRKGGKAGFIRELCQASYRSTEEVEGRYGEVGPSVPVKIIWGREDNWIPVESAHTLGGALKAKEVVVIEEAGHLVMLDQPAQVGVELGRWLSIVSLGAS